MTAIEKRITTKKLDGVQLHLRAWGKPAAQPMVLLHGGGANVHWWDHLAPIWAEHRYVVALDFRGHGDSDHPDQLVVGAFNDDLEALLEHLETERVLLVGHSMGAHVALDHACRHPQTHGLVLIDPSRGGGKKLRRRARLALALKRSYHSREEAIARYRFLPGSDHAPEALRVAIATESVRVEADGRFGFKFDPRWFGLPPRTPPDPSDVACPALVVRGAESLLLSSEGAESLAASLPAGRTCEIERAGHHVLLDAPLALAQAVSDFADEIDAD